MPKPSTDLYELSASKAGAQGEKKNGYPESSKVCYSIILEKSVRGIQNHCIANFSELHNDTRANKVW